MESAALLSAKNVTVTFGGVDVVASVDLELSAGEIHAIVGENGAGKSSLAKAIAGVYRMREGSVTLDGAPRRFKNPREALQAGIALIHQEPLTFPDLDVTENVLTGNFVRRGPFVDHRACEERVASLLGSLGVNIPPRRRAAGLSVADRQMMELAAALAHDARVWFFDETTAPLTPKETSELFKVMQGLRDRGCAVAIVTHHLDEVFAIADRITVLRDGNKVTERKTADTDPEEIVRLMVGREVERQRLGGASAGPCVLETHGLSGYGFSGIDVRVCQGEVVGLAGLVGSGRTELLRSLFGVAPIKQGSVVLEGRQLFVKSPRQARARGIALVPEDRIHDGLLLPQSVAFNSTLAHLPHLQRLGFLRHARIREMSKNSASNLNLSYRHTEQPVRELSGGNQQKVVLGKWLMTGPRLLMLDEPTRGVDVGAKREVHKAIRDLAHDGLAVLMASSDLPEVLSLCDRIYVMREGMIVAELNAEGADEETVMGHATGSGV